MKILNISKEKIVEFEIPTGNPLLLKFGDNLKVQDINISMLKELKKYYLTFKFFFNKLL